MWWLSVFIMLLLLRLHGDCCGNSHTSSEVEKILTRPRDCGPHDIGLCMDTVTRAIASLLGGRLRHGIDIIPCSSKGEWYVHCQCMPNT